MIWRPGLPAHGSLAARAVMPTVRISTGGLVQSVELHVSAVRSGSRAARTSSRVTGHRPAGPAAAASTAIAVGRASDPWRTPPPGAPAGRPRPRITYDTFRREGP